MQTVFLYMLLTTAAYHLGARALITEWLWSRYPTSLDNFMQCAACSGTWYGLLFGLAGQGGLELDFLGLTGRWSALAVGAGAMVWTPVLAAVHERSLRYLGGE